MRDDKLHVSQDAGGELQFSAHWTTEITLSWVLITHPAEAGPGDWLPRRALWSAQRCPPQICFLVFWAEEGKQGKEGQAFPWGMPLCAGLSVAEDRGLGHWTHLFPESAPTAPVSVGFVPRPCHSRDRAPPETTDFLSPHRTGPNVRINAALSLGISQ